MTQAQKSEIRKLKGKNFTDKYIDKFAKKWDEAVFRLKSESRKRR